MSWFITLLALVYELSNAGCRASSVAFTEVDAMRFCTDDLLTLGNPIESLLYKKITIIILVQKIRQQNKYLRDASDILRLIVTNSTRSQISLSRKIMCMFLSIIICSI